MGTIELDSATVNQLVEFSSGHYWKHANFWIEIGFAIVGIIIGYLAFREASKAFKEAGKAKDAATAAKDAAIKAGKTVKKQSILLAISDTTRVMSQVRRNINYDDANDKLMDINGRVRNIFGFYRDDQVVAHQALLQQIESCTSELLTSFNLLDSEVANNVIYNTIRPNITILAGHLNELQGVLENELISNN